MRENTEKNLSDTLKQLNYLIKTLKIKISRDKEQPYYHVQQQCPVDKRWLWCAVGVMIFLGASILVLALVLTVRYDNPASSEPENQVNNPSFERISTVGESAADWDQIESGYSLLARTSTSIHMYPQNYTYAILGNGSDDSDIYPVIPKDGNVCIRLGSTNNLYGYKIYSTRQIINIDYTQNAECPESVSLSSWCNPTYTGNTTASKFYVTLTPIYDDGTYASWQSRLFFTNQLPEWEYQEKVITFADTEREVISAFEVAITMETWGPYILYCDVVSLVYIHVT